MSSFEYWRFLDLFSSSVKQEYALWRSFFPLQHYEAFNLELNRKRRRNFFFFGKFFLTAVEVKSILFGTKLQTNNRTILKCDHIEAS